MTKTELQVEMLHIIGSGAFGVYNKDNDILHFGEMPFDYFPHNEFGIDYENTEDQDFIINEFDFSGIPCQTDSAKLVLMYESIGLKSLKDNNVIAGIDDRINYVSLTKKGYGNLTEENKKTCIHFSDDWIGQLSAVYMNDFWTEEVATGSILFPLNGIGFHDIQSICYCRFEHHKAPKGWSFEQIGDNWVVFEEQLGFVSDTLDDAILAAVKNHIDPKVILKK